MTPCALKSDPQKHSYLTPRLTGILTPWANFVILRRKEKRQITLKNLYMKQRSTYPKCAHFFNTLQIKIKFDIFQMQFHSSQTGVAWELSWMTWTSAADLNFSGWLEYLRLTQTGFFLSTGLIHLFWPFPLTGTSFSNLSFSVLKYLYFISWLNRTSLTDLNFI